MRALAVRFGEDPVHWGMAGLAHDLDLNVCAVNLEQHTLIAAEVLRAAGVNEDIVLAVLGHNNKAPRDSRMAKALWVVDHTTGMITAAALIRPSKSTADLDVSSVRKRMKDKRFAANVKREQIVACEAGLGMALDDFLSICLGAMNDIRDVLHLNGHPAPVVEGGK